MVLRRGSDAERAVGFGVGPGVGIRPGVGLLHTVSYINIEDHKYLALDLSESWPLRRRLRPTITAAQHKTLLSLISLSIHASYVFRSMYWLHANWQIQVQHLYRHTHGVYGSITICMAPFNARPVHYA